MVTPPPRSKPDQQQQQQQPNLGEALSELHLGARIATRSPLRAAAAAAAVPARAPPLSASFEEGATPPPPPALDLGEPGTAPAALANMRRGGAAGAPRPKTRAALAKAVATALPPSSSQSSEADEGGSGSDAGEGGGSGSAAAAAAMRRTRRAAAAAAASGSQDSSSSRLRPRPALPAADGGATTAAREETAAAAVASVAVPAEPAASVPADPAASAAAAAATLPAEAPSTKQAADVEDAERRRKKEAATTASASASASETAATAFEAIPRPPPETRLSLSPSNPSLSDQAVGLCYDPGMELHIPPGPHVERPARTATLAALLVKLGIAARCRAVTPRPASDCELVRAHSREHVAEVDGHFDAVAGKVRRDAANAAALTRAQAAAAARGGGGSLNNSNPPASTSSPSSESNTNPLVPFESGDMFWSSGTASAARLAAGCVTQAALSVLSGEARRAFAVVRPPGHHAECSRAQGFCFYNNVALAALASIEAGAKKVLVVDWDVHHGMRGRLRLFSLVLQRLQRILGALLLLLQKKKKKERLKIVVRVSPIDDGPTTKKIPTLSRKKL